VCEKYCAAGQATLSSVPVTRTLPVLLGFSCCCQTLLCLSNQERWGMGWACGSNRGE